MRNEAVMKMDKFGPYLKRVKKTKKKHTGLTTDVLIVRRRSDNDETTVDGNRMLNASMENPLPGAGFVKMPNDYNETSHSAAPMERASQRGVKYGHHKVLSADGSHFITLAESKDEPTEILSFDAVDLT